MLSYGGEDTEQQKTVGKWLIGYVENWKCLDPTELKHTYREVDDIAQGCMIGKLRIHSKEYR